MDCLLQPDDLEEAGSKVHGFKKKFTLDQYLQELREPHLIRPPSKTDPNDAGYHRKYAMSMPPLICYRYKQHTYELVNTEDDINRRFVFYAWNNMTHFEQREIQKFKNWLQQTHGYPISADFNDWDILKFLQSFFFKMPKAGEMIYAHLQWRDSLVKKPALTQRSLDMIHAGGFYILGRDKCYRPIVIIDALVLVEMIKKDKHSVTDQTFIDTFVFLWQYMRNVMFLPGMSDIWVQIVSCGNLGMTSLPRKPIMAVLDLLQKNVMFATHKLYFVNCSWGIKTLYNGLRGFIDPQIQEKIGLTDKNCVPDFAQRIHPCQLEKRFGGNVDTPTNFWPPYVGPEFQPPGTPFEGEIMNEQEYKQALAQNTEMVWHPEYMTSKNCLSRDFIYEEPQLLEEILLENTKDLPNQNSLNKSKKQLNEKQTIGEFTTPSSKIISGSVISKSESVYFEAYTGIESIDKQVYLQNLLIREAYDQEEAKLQQTNKKTAISKKEQFRSQSQDHAPQDSIISEEPFLETSFENKSHSSEDPLNEDHVQDQELQTEKKKGCCCVIF